MSLTRSSFIVNIVLPIMTWFGWIVFIALCLGRRLSIKAVRWKNACEAASDFKLSAADRPVGSNLHGRFACAYRRGTSEEDGVSKWSEPRFSFIIFWRRLLRYLNDPIKCEQAWNYWVIAKLLPKMKLIQLIRSLWLVTEFDGRTMLV